MMRCRANPSRRRFGRARSQGTPSAETPRSVLPPLIVWPACSRWNPPEDATPDQQGATVHVGRLFRFINFNWPKVR